MGYHSNTERFIADWRARRGAGPIPHRRDLDPALFGAMAPQLFMLGTREEGRSNEPWGEKVGGEKVGGEEVCSNEVGGDVFRVAGALLVDLHGRALAGSAFARLWARPDRHAAVNAVARARRETAPVVLVAEGVTVEEARVGLEITLAPVLGSSGAPDRTLGLYQPVSPLTKLAGRALGGLRLQQVSVANDPRPSHLKLVAVAGRRVA